MRVDVPAVMAGAAQKVDPQAVELRLACEIEGALFRKCRRVLAQQLAKVGERGVAAG